MIKELLTEKLRPKRFDHLILPTRIKAALNHGSLAQNVLLYGSPGTGKTSAAKVLALGSPNMYINVSDESSVETIRTKITDFCSQATVLEDSEENPLAPKQENGRPIKIVVLDEVDGASDQFFKALRATIEKFAKTSRFIATCNFINKIPDHIQSRFECISFDFVSKEEENEVLAEWHTRMRTLFEKMSIEVDDETMGEFIKRNFPDMRSALNKLQSFSVRKITKLTKKQMAELSWSFEDLYKVLLAKPDPVKNYEFVMSNYASMVEDVMNGMATEFIVWLKENHPAKANTIPHIIIATASHQAQRNMVIDPAVSLLSLCFTIQKMMNDGK